MASKALPATSVKIGAAVLAAVDRLGLQPEGAFWLFDDVALRWRFYIMSSLIDLAGPRWLFLRLNRVLPLMVPGYQKAFDIHLGSPKELLANDIKTALAQAPRRGASQRAIDFGEGKENLVIYRIQAPMSDRAMHQTRVVFRKKVREISEVRMQ